MGRKINYGEIDLNQISVMYCFNCPYPECIATDLELCPYLKEKANDERAKYETEASQRDDEALEKIGAILSEPLSMNEIADKTGLGNGYIQSLKRRGRLKTKKVKYGRTSRVFIVGVK